VLYWLQQGKNQYMFKKEIHNKVSLSEVLSNIKNKEMFLKMWALLLEGSCSEDLAKKIKNFLKKVSEHEAFMCFYEKNLKDLIVELTSKGWVDSSENATLSLSGSESQKEFSIILHFYEGSRLEFSLDSGGYVEDCVFLVLKFTPKETFKENFYSTLGYASVENKILEISHLEAKPKKALEEIEETYFNF